MQLWMNRTTGVWNCECVVDVEWLRGENKYSIGVKSSVVQMYLDLIATMSPINSNAQNDSTHYAVKNNLLR